MSVVNPTTYGNVVIGPALNASHTISITGAGPSNSVLVSNGTGTNWATNVARTTAKGQMHLEGPDADLVINNKSLSDWMTAIEKRLSILQPNPELHEKYEALKTAYEHYKTLEALLYDDQKSNK